MLKNKRAAFLRMTIDASFPRRFAEHGLVVRAMRVVAIRAFHQSFWNAVVRRQSKLRLNRRMARVTQLRLRLAQQAFSQPSIRLVDARPV